MCGVGLECIVDYLFKFGFLNSDINCSELLVFGSVLIILFEFVCGMSVFVNGGYLIKFYFIIEI